MSLFYFFFILWDLFFMPEEIGFPLMSMEFKFIVRALVFIQPRYC